MDKERTITNVAAGRLSATSTDAVNGSQLHSTNQSIDVLAGTPLSFAGNSGTVSKKLGETLTIRGDKSTAGSYSAANLNTEVDAHGDLVVQMADNPEFTSAIIGGGTTLDGSGLTISGGPAITTAGVNAGDQKVTHVAAGELSSTSTDAVNGSQLHATNQNVTTNTTNIAQNTTDIANLATTPLSFAGNSGTVSKKLGETLTIRGDKSTAGSYSAGNLNTEVDQNGDLVVQMADSPEFASAIIGGGTTLDGSGLTISGGPAITTAGVNAGDLKVTHVAAGELSGTSTDAVNGSQLHATNQNVATNTTNIAQNTTDIANLAGTPLNFAGNSGTVSKNLGETLTIRGDKSTAGSYSAGNLNTEVDQNGDLVVQMADSPEFASAIIGGGTTLDGSGLTISGGPAITTAGVNAGDLKITHVAAGELSGTSTDAVNGSQLHATNQNVATNTTNIAQNTTDIANLATTPLSFAGNSGTVSKKLGEMLTIRGDKSTAGSYSAGNLNTEVDQNGDLVVQMADSPEFASAIIGGGTTLDGSGLTISGGPAITTAGVNAGDQKVTHVAAGELSGTSTDAVNGSQLHATNQNVTTNTTNIAQNTQNISALGDSVENVYTGGTKYFHANSTGTDSQALGLDSVAIGTGAVANNAGDIALGAGSLTEAAVGTSGVTLRGTDYAFAGANPASTLSVGSEGAERTITHVAAGRLSETSTDAVNGSQLYATNTAVENLNAGVGGLQNDALLWDETQGAFSASHGDSAVNKITHVAAGELSSTSTDAVNGSQLYATNQNVTTNTTNIAQNTTNITQNTTDIANLAGTPLNFAGNSGTVSKKLGETLTIRGDKSTAGSYSAVNLNTEVDAHGDLVVQMADSPEFASAIIGGTTTLDGSGLTISGGPAITTAGVNAGDQKVTHVGAGELSSTSTDAVNGSQLHATNQNVTTNTTNIAQNTTDIANLATTPLSFAGNSGTVSKKLGETLTIRGDKSTAGSYSAGNLNTEVDQNGDLVVQMADNPEFASAIIGGGTTLDGSGLTISGGPAITTAGVNAGDQKVTHVAAGELNGTSTDAVNGSQLHATNTAVENLNAGVGGLQNDALLWDADKGAFSASHGDTAVNKITHVAAGELSGTSTDAVNGSQLHATNQNVATNTTNIAQNTTDIANLATTPLSFAGNSGTVSKKLGEMLTIRGDKSTAGSYSAANLNTEVDQNGDLVVQMADNPEFASAIIGTTTALDGSGLTISGGPAITTAGVNAGDLKVTHVAAGELSGTSTDAVNGSQLYATNQNVTTNTTNIAQNTTNITQNTTDIANLAGTPLNFAGNSGTVSKKLGETLTIRGDKSTAGSYSAVNLNTEVDAHGDLVVQMADSPEFTSAIIGGTTTLDGSGLTISGGPAITTAGVNAGDQKVTHVGAGELSSTSTDAVNGSQLHATNQNVTTNTTNIAQNTQNISALGDSVENVYTGGTKYFHANSTGTDSQALGLDSVAIGTGAVANNAGDIALGAGSLTEAAVGTSGVTLRGTDYAFAGANPASTLSVGSEGAE
ncbi:beta strand repeat-containing protein, partial [Klebsiella indica]|uniref:beta strand repeat-containing protein n=1 Tax=Klebsiella indica TaxID=2582917 RepID=UPI001F4F2BF1